MGNVAGGERDLLEQVKAARQQWASYLDEVKALERNIGGREDAGYMLLTMAVDAREEVLQTLRDVFFVDLDANEVLPGGPAGWSHYGYTQFMRLVWVSAVWRFIISEMTRVALMAGPERECEVLERAFFWLMGQRWRFEGVTMAHPAVPEEIRNEAALNLVAYNVIHTDTRFNRRLKWAVERGNVDQLGGDNRFNRLILEEIGATITAWHDRPHDDFAALRNRAANIIEHEAINRKHLLECDHRARLGIPDSEGDFLSTGGDDEGVSMAEVGIVGSYHKYLPRDPVVDEVLDAEDQARRELQIWHTFEKAKLSHREREVITMRLDGLKLREIAILLGVTLGSVSKTNARAEKKLQAIAPSSETSSETE